ncbi:MAG TPA: PqqD family protein [Vicinamibacterales bacterium]|nr:PqqD family protein [Vicinamibacterales bacterium]
MQGLNEDIRFGIPSDVVGAEVDGEMVLLNARTGVYYSLDSVGARFWVLVGEGRTLGGIMSALLTEYDVESAVLRSDLEALISDLQENALLRVSAPD